MKTILDEIEEVGNKKKTYSRLSFFASIINLGLLFFLGNYVSNNYLESGILYQPPMRIIHSIRISLLIGVIISILSFAKKEPSNWMKWVGIVFNVLLLAVVLGAIFYYRILG